MKSLAALQKEAEHSYQVYLESTNVIQERRAKMSLLKWVDACSTAIECIDNPSPDSYALLRKELEACTVQPIKIIHDSTCDHYEQLVGRKTRSEPWYIAPQFDSAIPDVVVVKNTLIAQTNVVFSKLKEFTGQDYPEINIYDHSSN